MSVVSVIYDIYMYIHCRRASCRRATAWRPYPYPTLPYPTLPYPTLPDSQARELSASHRLALFLDMHGHSSKKGFFLYCCDESVAAFPRFSCFPRCLPNPKPRMSIFQILNPRP
jgi:hypothetical protein